MEKVGERKANNFFNNISNLDDTSLTDKSYRINIYKECVTYTFSQIAIKKSGKKKTTYSHFVVLISQQRITLLLFYYKYYKTNFCGNIRVKEI